MKNKQVLAALLSLLFLAGCSNYRSFESSSLNPDELVGQYTLAPLDPIYVSLLGIPEEKQMQSVIDEKGEITIPYVKEPIQAAGKTTSELEREIQRIYMDGGIYRNITVNIQTSAKIYYMEGEVNRPQEYELNRRITLLQAIAAASGYTEYADKEDVTITRRGEIIKVDAKKLEKNPEMDIPIEAGDRIKVDRSWY